MSRGRYNEQVSFCPGDLHSLDEMEIIIPSEIEARDQGFQILPHCMAYYPGSLTDIRKTEP